MYKAVIYFDAYEDDYNEGEGKQVANWMEELTAETTEELKKQILESTNSKWEDLDDEQINSYDWCTEYHTGYQAIDNNYSGLVPPSDYEIDQWKLGKEQLFTVNCHISVTEVTESKATL